VFGSLEPDARDRVRQALERLAIEVATPGRVGGKSVKSIKGASDSFHRLRVGDHRVMFDVIPEDHVVLVLAIVHRRDLQRWLRNR
jgi:mRNA-degrading endonuclease RelE of RelBE toxin-antitoxin system